MTVGVWGAIEVPVHGRVEVLPNPEQVQAKPFQGIRSLSQNVT